MSHLGISLAWCAVQVTLAMMPVAVVYGLATRRGPRSASWSAALGLGLIIVLTFSQICTNYNYKNIKILNIQRIASAAHTERSSSALDLGRSDAVHHAPSLVRGYERGWSLTRLRDLWEKARAGPTVAPAPLRRGAEILAFVFLTGAAIGVLQLLLGLWAVHECRRASKEVDDIALNGLLATLCARIGYRGRIELREVSDLPAPATAGWIAPMILLPSDWPSWDDGERRAVLAHELAHICRADYAAGLLARLAAALHFYHPCVRWLAGRLLLQQELAADAIGAQIAGGREAYLFALSRMALRQERGASCWSVRGFLPTRGTLIRRIRMLQDVNRSADKHWSLTVRTLLAALLMSVVAGLSLVRGPVFAADDNPTAQTVPSSKPTAKSEPQKQGPAFDLSYVPDDVTGVLAFRPAATFRRSGMKPFADQLNTLVLLKELWAEMGLQRLDFKNRPPGVESIEQLTVGVYIEKRIRGDGTSRAMKFQGLMIRTLEPFDWKALIRAWPLGAVERTDAGRVYFELSKIPTLGKNACAYIPDERTIVFNEEEYLLPMIRRAVPNVPAVACWSDWKRVEHDLFAVAINNHDNFLTSDFSKDDPSKAAVQSLFEQTSRWIFAAADADQLKLRAFGDCTTARAGETTARAVETLIANALREIGEPVAVPNQGDKSVRARLAILQQLLRGCGVEREGRTVTIAFGADARLADFAALVRDDLFNGR
jgi:beta-lactamase regulating signal transducer with metallopeptidase domain